MKNRMKKTNPEDEIIKTPNGSHFKIVKTNESENLEFEDDEFKQTFSEFYYQKGPEGKKVRKAVKLCIFLIIVSVVVSIVGLIDEWREWNHIEGYAFFVISSFFLYLGIYIYQTLRKALDLPPNSYDRK